MNAGDEVCLKMYADGIKNKQVGLVTCIVVAVHGKDVTVINSDQTEVENPQRYTHTQEEFVRVDEL